MIEIPLHNSNFMATIDDEDYLSVSSRNWYLYDYKERTLYAQDSKGLKLHCFIIPVVPDGFVRHHKDGNGLNCQRSNLEMRSTLHNLQGKSIYKNNSSGYPGVKWHNAANKWAAQITVFKKRRYLGVFTQFEEAVKARQEAEKKYKGQET